jgi:F-type H+-transporting ATPase subunit delta
MAEKATIARPYAKAAFAHAREQGNLSRWSEVLATSSAVVSDPRVAGLLGNPKVTPDELVTLLVDIGGIGSDATLRNYITTLAANRRLALLPEIAAMFEVMRADIENVADVQVVSAVELDDAQRQRLAGALKKRLRRDVRLHCSVEASLIGGAIIRSQDLVIDGSLSARLKRLTTELTN